MRILFLDDDLMRHKLFREELANRGHIATHVETADRAIQELSNNKFDLVYLDHDLGDKTFVPSEGSEPTGYTVALFMAKGSDRARVVVHSYNPAGAQKIVQHLDDAGFKVDWRPFGPSMFDGLM